jgi:hypothetical protein
MSVSPHSNSFILKGASLFLVWQGQSYRVTKDADFLAVVPADPEYLIGILEEICVISIDGADGIQFLPETIRAAPIREEQEYGGIRATLTGLLHQARIPLQIDIGFGDEVTPEPEAVRFPTLLGGPAPRIMAYPRYTMVAEKLKAMVRLGIVNSRMKDFYDVWLLSRIFEFDGRTLTMAIRNTFHRRSTPVPDDVPVAFRDEFTRSTEKNTQWKAFLRKSEPGMCRRIYMLPSQKSQDSLCPLLHR